MADLSPIYYEPASAASNAIITTDELKGELYLAGNDEDTRVNRIVAAVTDTISNKLGRPVRSRAYYGYLSRAPKNMERILLPLSPIRSVNDFQVYRGGTWVTLDSAVYTTRVTRLWTDPTPPPPWPVVVEPTATDGWGDLDADEVEDPFRVEVTAGWEPVPSGIKDAAMKLCVDRFTLRGTLVDVEQYRAGTVVQTMFQDYRAPVTVRFIGR